MTLSVYALESAKDVASKIEIINACIAYAAMTQRLFSNRVCLKKIKKSRTGNKSEY